MGKVKKPKLTPAQQEVVNLMAAGWALHHNESSWGGRFPERAWISKGDKDKRLKSNTPQLLLAKGAIEVTRGKFALTELGKSLAVPVEESKPEVWWSIGRWNDKPDQETFARSTADSLFDARGRRTAKCSEYATYFETREQAIAEIHLRLKAAVDKYARAHAIATETLADFERKEKLV
jgi:hypothetical protein